MKLAVSILDADRTQTAKANVHANKAKSLAEQSMAIIETIKDFECSNLSTGFQFPSGRNETQANNFPLMNKIICAVNTTPKRISK